MSDTFEEEMNAAFAEARRLLRTDVLEPELCRQLERVNCFTPRGAYGIRFDIAARAVEVAKGGIVAWHAAEAEKRERERPA